LHFPVDLLFIAFRVFHPSRFTFEFICVLHCSCIQLLFATNVVIFQFVLSQSNLIVDYKFDVSSERWCEVVFQLPLGNKSKLDLATIVEKEVEKFIVHQTPGIERCIESEEVVNDVPTKFLQTQGINLEVRSTE
ncbi:hypothetical protein OESDEN_18255, partial [Oesophagostomum dentatum]